MNRIHILDEGTINKIAAGEVIERPSSVVKELIENSIDAGATDIRIEIRGSGIQSIKVIDNGTGMSREDVSIAFLKHATSKINNAQDIESVRTLGFRGEALSSITAVARVEIMTRQRGELAGTRLAIEGGEIKKISDAGAAEGTSVLVEDLFYNIPARRKFLKSKKTEMAHIVDVVVKNALGHGNISFSLSYNEKELFRSPSSVELFDTLIHVYGPDIARELVPVDFSRDGIDINGFVSRPTYSRSERDYQSFYINERWVNSRTMANAVRLGYYTLLPKGRYPAAIIKLSMDPEEVDVNVHPTKQEVRFNRELMIMEVVSEAVRSALDGLVPAKEMSTKQTALYEEKVAIEPVLQERRTEFKTPLMDTDRRLKRTERVIGVTEHPEIKILGQVDLMYIIALDRQGLLIIDQHAAHERIMYEQVLDAARTGSQELIVPVNLDLDPREMVLIKEYLPYLEEAGFAVSEFGPGSYAVTSVPHVLGKLEEASIVHDIIYDVLSEGKIKDETGILDRVSKSAACRGAIKAGALLTMEQMENLVAQLYRAKRPYTCPHGRPTMIVFGREDLDRLFKRM